MFSVIPEPYKFQIKSQEIAFTLSDGISVCFCDKAQRAEQELREFIENVMGFECLGTSAKTITLKIDKALEKEESYKILVEKDRILIYAFDERGSFYATQTLKQLFYEGKGELEEIEIYDFPQYKYRAFMLDVARYFFSVEAVKLFIDALALHKLNVLHLHLTDDQGWRVELYSKLLLAQIGGFRPYTNLNKTPHGGFYSKEDIEEIISYAENRFITVIPEISQPAHTLSAVAAYPFLSCDEKEVEVATSSGTYNGLCIGKESTFEFMKEVLDEVGEMFPSKIIHIGAEYVPSKKREDCKLCVDLMKKEGLKDQRELHFYYVKKIGEYLKSKGYEVIVRCKSEDIGLLSKAFIFELCEESADKNKTKLKAEREKIRVINAFSDAWDLEKPYGEINLKDAYEKSVLKKDENTYTLGAEAFLYTNYVPSMKKAGKLVFPRLCAFSESVWSGENKKDFHKFQEKLSSYEKLLKTLPFDYTSQKKSMPSSLRKMAEKLSCKIKKYNFHK